MIKTIGFLLLWLGGSAAAVAVAWTGVSVVDDDLIHPAPANTIAVSNDDSTANNPSRTDPATPPDGASAEPASPPASKPAPVSNQATKEPTIPETNAPSPAPTSNPQPTAAPTSLPPQTQPPQPTTTQAPAPAPTTTSTTTVPTPTSTTSSPTSTSQPAQTLTFNLIGGSTAIAFSSTNVQVLWATPNPGFEVKIEPESPGIKVEFRADHHRSRIDAWWSNGPQTNIREEPDN